MFKFVKRLFFKKSLSNIEIESEHFEKKGSLKKVLSVYDLTLFGIAAVIGAGVFSTIGRAAYGGGPGISILFLITAVTCGFSALCYAEFASRVSIAGSAYTYAYICFGEIIAWIIGWSLILEYSIGNVVVAISWSSYFENLLRGFHIQLPEYLLTNYGTAKRAFEISLAHKGQFSTLTPDVIKNYQAYIDAPVILGRKFILNIPAFVIVSFISALTYIGIKESKKSTNAMVIFKIIVIIFIIVLGFYYVTPQNWSPFMPNGIGGVLAGVSAVFYAYIGFDAISTTSEECKNPKRDLPLGMIYSLIICTILYILVALVLTGVVNYKELNVDDPLAYIFERIKFSNISYIISISAIVATTSVLLVFQIGQPRIWMSMSRDGLLPKRFGNIHPKYKTPGFSTLICGAIIAILALFADSGLMTELTSIGTLFAFVIVCIGVLFLPPRPEINSKGYKLPYFNGRYIIPIIILVFFYFNLDKIKTIFAPEHVVLFSEVLFLIFIVGSFIAGFFTYKLKLNVIPIVGALSCMFLMTEIPAISWVFFLIWLSLGLTIYFGYSKSHSNLNPNKMNPTQIIS